MTRSKYKKQLLAENRFCIYCGGTEPATNVDHMPNKGMFPKDRPGGMEFPSCEGCNQGSKWFEDIASFIGSIRFGVVPGVEHFEGKLLHLQRTHPEVLEELHPTTKQKREARKYKDAEGQDSGALNVTGRIVSSAMLLYGAKLALALHWQETKNVLPVNGRVGVIWHSNANALENEIPPYLFEMLPDGRTLRQGTKQSKHPFLYSSGKTVDTDATAHWAFFGDAFAFNLFVGQTINLGPLPPNQCFSPGCLRISKPATEFERIGWPIGPIKIT